MKPLWPTLLAICTASLCLGLLEASLDMRGATVFVRPFHYYGTLITVLLVVSIFWPLYRSIGWFRRRGTFLISILYLVLLFSAWAVALPLGDHIAIHYQRLDPQQFTLANEPPGYGWFYVDDSGMGGSPMNICYLLLALSRPWLPVMFLAFLPCFFYLYRNSNATGNA